MSDQGEKTKDDPPQEYQKKKKEDLKSRTDEADSIADMLLSDVAKENGSPGKCDTDGDSQQNVENKKENQKPSIDVEDFQNPLKKICRESSVTSSKDYVPTDPIALMLHSDANGDSRENVENKKENQKPSIDVEDFRNPLKKICRESSVTSSKDYVPTDPIALTLLSDADGNSRENVENKKENEKPRNDVEDLRILFKKMIREASVSGAPLPIKETVPLVPRAVNLLSEVDDDSRENLENKKENLKCRIEVKDFQSPLKKICSESSITGAPLPIKVSAPTDPTAVNLLFDADDSRENVENKKENQKPRNDVANSQNPFKKSANSWKPISNADIATKDSVSALDKQNPPRKKPEKNSYTRRLLSDQETQIGFFKGVIDYNELNKKYPFVDSNSMNAFIRNWLEVGDSVKDVMEAVRVLKLHYRKRLHEIEGKLDRLDPEGDKIFDLAHKIWGSTKKPAIEALKTSYSTDEAECSKKCPNDDDYGGTTAVKMMKEENSNITIPLNNMISILIKIIDFQLDHGRYPFENVADAAYFNNEWVQLDISVETLVRNVLGFRKEYMEARARQLCSFDSREEELFYNLADQLWGHK